MGLFGKKEKRDEIPQLPELPKLPSMPHNIYNSSEDQIPTKEFPTEEKYSREIHELPSFPTDDFSDKFSQDSIKSAVKGKDEPKMHESLSFDMKGPEIEEPEIKKISVPVKKQTEIPKEQPSPAIHENEPVFIRIDKFEESLKIFDKVKDKMTEIEHLLKETKELKEKETEELSNWEEEVQKLKMHIEKVDKDVFSKIE